MKITDVIDASRYAAAWKEAMAGEKSWLYDMEVALSPAIQAQMLPDGIQGTSGQFPVLSPMHNMYNTFEYIGWKQEALAITRTGYIGDWTYLRKILLTGPDVIECLKASTIQKFGKFPVGKAKHILFVRDDGKIIVDGIAFRLAEDQVLCTGGMPIAQGVIRTEGLKVDAQDITFKEFEFHVQGPVSRETLEKATGESLEDIGFTWFRDSKIGEIPVRIFRGGMSGELGYEVHGKSEYASVIWNAIVEAGAPLGLVQLGHRTMPFNHLEAFFPTCWVDYIPAVFPADEATADVLFHTPIEYGWISTIDFDRDFPAKQALLEELDHPKKKCVMLEWNSEDVMKIYESLFDDDPESIDLPALPVKTDEIGYDFAIPILTQDYQLAGFATNRGYSPRTKKFVSITSLKAEYAEEGTELLVKYGNEGRRQIMIRAKVVQTPYKADNRK